MSYTVSMHVGVPLDPAMRRCVERRLLMSLAEGLLAQGSIEIVETPRPDIGVHARMMSARLKPSSPKPSELPDVFYGRSPALVPASASNRLASALATLATLRTEQRPGKLAGAATPAQLRLAAAFLSAVADTMPAQNVVAL
jgi:hypothetical protein